MRTGRFSPISTQVVRAVYSSISCSVSPLSREQSAAGNQKKAFRLSRPCSKWRAWPQGDSKFKVKDVQLRPSGMGRGMISLLWIFWILPGVSFWRFTRVYLSSGRNETSRPIMLFHFLYRCNVSLWPEKERTVVILRTAVL